MSAVRTGFAIIGAGITGLSTAWALARRGREFTIIDQAEVGHRDGGSHGSCRVFRLGYDDPDYVRLAAEAARWWSHLGGDCGEQLLYPTSQLTSGPQMPKVLAAMREAGERCELLQPGQAAGLFPGVALSGDVLVEPGSAVIAAGPTLRWLAGLAAEASDPMTGVRVTSLADDGRRVTLGTTAGAVEAHRVIVCAGPWTAQLLAPAGITVPASATLEQVAYLRPAARSGTTGPRAGLGTAGDDAAEGMPIFIHYGAEIPYGLPVPGSDLYKIGIHHGGPLVDPGRQDHTPDASLTERIELAARRFLPGFDPHPVETERCVYDNSPDTDFIVDKIGNVVIGSGTSGHGFKFGPLLGQWLAALATDDVSDFAGEHARRFSLGRFRGR